MSSFIVLSEGAGIKSEGKLGHIAVRVARAERTLTCYDWV